MEARKAALAWRAPLKPGGKRVSRRDPSKLIENYGAIRKRVESVKRVSEDDLRHWNEFDFCERYQGLGRSPEKSAQLWVEAVHGRFPPWTPSWSRGEQCVCKLDPATIRKKHSVGVKDETSKAQRRDMELKISPKAQKRLKRDGGNLLPSDDDGVFPPAACASPKDSRPSGAATVAAVSPSPQPVVAAARARSSAHSAPGSFARPRPQRMLPSSFIPHGGGLAMTTAGGIPKAGGGGLGVGGGVEGCAVAKVPKLKALPLGGSSGEELREELFAFDDIVEDPVDFTKILSHMPTLVEEAFQANKVEKGD